MLATLPTTATGPSKTTTTVIIQPPKRFILLSPLFDDPLPMGPDKRIRLGLLKSATVICVSLV